ncbi:HSP20 family protein [Desulfocicer vacuolatum DSM 3385]|uniref:HSP20 family protein n=1 Tax=Desulfocicer vacuolatum DSM 3385 TaxID=1121400 RepID=A0A1W2BE73_9BACT|nr:archaeal heat shock protein Hsp20 [Desulfocicer vacuolatum]SMC71134.1 HSP20 family protein [Desulfocicer vacuolatum DSM 3385]
MTRPEKEKKQSKSPFDGVLTFLEKLGELAEKGEQLSKTISFEGKDNNIKGVYGFSMKMGLGSDKPEVQPFGNIRKDEKSGESFVHEVREPLVDIFEEKDHILVVAEMPGTSLEDIKVNVHEDLLEIDASKGDKKYKKEVLLPRSFSREKMKISCNNGILEIKCMP